MYSRIRAISVSVGGSLCRNISVSRTAPSGSDVPAQNRSRSLRISWTLPPPTSMMRTRSCSCGQCAVTPRCTSLASSSPPTTSSGDPRMLEALRTNSLRFEASRTADVPTARMLSTLQRSFAAAMRSRTR